MRASIKKRGNGAAVCIPASVMRAAGLRFGQKMDVRQDAGSVVIAPVAGPVFGLTALLAMVTDENIHPEIDFGRPMGRDGAGVG